MLAELKKIIKAGAQAPSGDNCQPWRFVARPSEAAIEVFDLPERDLSYYNYDHRTSWVAHGALLENMLVQARAMGYVPTTQFFPPSGAVVRVSFQTGAVNDVNLADALFERVTNRKPYEPTIITPETLADWRHTADEVGYGKVVATIEPTAVQHLAMISGKNEQILFENKALHNFFFQHINWTKAEEEARRSGMYIDTLELKPEQHKAFNLFKNWNILSVLNKIGVSRFIAKENGKLYATASAMVGVTIPDLSPESFVKAGQIFERLWLKTTAAGLALQPLSGFVFLMHRIRDKAVEQLPVRHQRLVGECYEIMCRQLGVANDHLVLFARVGKAPPPRARALRLDPEITTQ